MYYAVCQLNCKAVSSGFYNHEIEVEITERNITCYFKGKEDDALDEFMSFTEDKRRTENYTHQVTTCSQMCKEKMIRESIWVTVLLLLPSKMGDCEQTLSYNKISSRLNKTLSRLKHC